MLKPERTIVPKRSFLQSSSKDKRSKFFLYHEYVTEDDVVLINDSKHGETYRFRQPIEVPEKPGFYLIPGFADYAINRQGDVWSLAYCKYVNFNVHEPEGNKRRGYFKCDLADRFKTEGRGRYHTSRHRLLMLTFTEYDFHPKTMQVNHINGVGGDDRLDNLEWSTNSENIRHAVDSGLISQNHLMVDCLNWRSGESLQVRTIPQAAVLTGLSVAQVTGRLKDLSVRMSDGWRFKLADQDWLPLALTDRARKSNRKVVVLCVRTGKITEYFSLVDAASDTGCKKLGVRAACRDISMVPMNGFIFRYSDQPYKFPMFTDLQIKYFDYIGWPYQILRGGYALWKNDQIVGVATAVELASMAGIQPGSVHNNFVKGRETAGYMLTYISPYGE